MIRPSRSLLLAVLVLLTLAGVRPALAQPDPQFTVNPNGTVTDSVTGLIWDRCSWGQDNDATCTGTAIPRTWQQALAVAVTANGASHKGHTDWRLPNRNELESLVKITASSPAIDTTAFPNTPSDWYWSSTPYTPVPAYAWGVGFDDGGTYADYLADDLHVRLVRSGQSFDAFDALAPLSYSVTPTAGAGGSISPTGEQTVNHGSTAQFTVTPNPGYSASVGGTCGGSLSGNTYTTSAITANCTVTATFAPVACGTADGVPTMTQPGVNLCNPGISSSPALVNGAWTWSCTGSNGGTPAACSAPGETIGGNPPGGGGNATFAAAGAGCTVNSVGFLPTPPGLPAGLLMPYGVVDFELVGCTGGSATIHVTYPGTVNGMQYWKYMDNGWVRMEGVTLAGHTATLIIEDNGEFDADPAEGVIADPSGPAMAVGGGGAMSVPTLSEWTLALLTILLGGMGWRARRMRMTADRS